MSTIRWRKSTWGNIAPDDQILAPDGSVWVVLTCMCDLDANVPGLRRDGIAYIRYWIQHNDDQIASTTHLSNEVVQYYRKRKVKPLTPEQLAAREAKAAQRAALREQRKQEKAKERIDARLAKIAEAAGTLLDLPAWKQRGQPPQSVPLARAIEICLDAITRSNALTIDIEHAGYQLGHNHFELRTVQLGNHTNAIVFDAQDDTHLVAVAMLLDKAPVLHAHSATADLDPLIVEEVISEDLWAKVDDTAIRARLASPAYTGDDAGLKDLVPMLIKEGAEVPQADAARAALFKTAQWLSKPKATTPYERNGWAQVDKRCAVMVDYAASDVLDTAPLPSLLPNPPQEILEREWAIQRMVSRIAREGLRLDPVQVSSLLATHSTARAQLADQIATFGVDNPDSDIQIGKKLIELGAQLPTTVKGNPSAAEAVLRAVRSELAGFPAGALAELTLNHRHHSTVLGLFLEPYQEYIVNGDGKVRPVVYTLGAGPGRMTCKRPNLQQVPQSGGVRSCITAWPGYLLISADFSGVEWRIAAALSGDETAIAEILAEDEAKRLDPNAKAGIHWKIAHMVFGADASKHHRYMVKRGVYGTMYSGGVVTLAKQMGCDETTAAEVIRTLRKLTPTYNRWREHVMSQVQQGRVAYPTYSGRVVHLKRAYPHTAVPHIIQGTGRELLVDGMLRWRKTQWGNSLILPVHDELIAMVPEAQAQQAVAELSACMQTKFRGVPIVVEANRPSFAWQDAA